MFSDLDDEKVAARIFQKSIENDRLAHAYLLTGGTPESAEKVALQVAKTLHCTSPPKRSLRDLPLDSCDKCRSCRQIENRQFADVDWVRPESKSRVITIAQIRSVLGGIHLKSHGGGYKVKVIVNADRMNAQAANAFLKTLEEPPDKSLILLLSSDPQRLLGTIISRCRRIPLSPRPPIVESETRDWLLSICRRTSSKKHGIGARYHLISELLELLSKRKSEIEKNLFAASQLASNDDLEPALRERYKQALVSNIEAEYRRERADRIALFQWFLRDIWLQTLRADQLLRLDFLSEQTRKIANRLTSKDALKNVELVDHLQRQLNTNVQEALAIELTLLRIIL